MWRYIERILSRHFWSLCLTKARLLLPFLPEWQVMLAILRHKDQCKCLWQAVDTVEAALGEGLREKRSLDVGSHTHARFLPGAQTSRRGNYSACSLTDEDSSPIKRQDYSECLNESFSQHAPQTPVLFTGVKINDVDRMSLSNLIREHAETMVRTSFLWPAWKLISCMAHFTKSSVALETLKVNFQAVFFKSFSVDNVQQNILLRIGHSVNFKKRTQACDIKLSKYALLCSTLVASIVLQYWSFHYSWNADWVMTLMMLLFILIKLSVLWHKV